MGDLWCLENGMKLSDMVEELYAIDISVPTIDRMVRKPEVRQVLGELEVGEDELEHLSDILDPDQGGTISVIDLLNGLKRLRGVPRRGDIVTIDLKCRSIQHAVMEL